MFAALYLPDFELQAALRHEPELHQQPVALLDSEEAKATILQLTKAAADAGVSLGVTPSQGLARCLRLIIKPRAFRQEKIASEILLHHAATLAPEIEATAPGSVHGAFYFVEKLPGKCRARRPATGAITTDRASGPGCDPRFKFSCRLSGAAGVADR